MDRKQVERVLYEEFRALFGRRLRYREFVTNCADRIVAMARADAAPPVIQHLPPDPQDEREPLRAHLAESHDIYDRASSLDDLEALHNEAHAKGWRAKTNA